MASALHVVASTDRRGAEVFAHDLVGALDRLGRDGELVAVAAGTSTATLPIPDLGGLSVPGVRRLRKRAAAHDHVVAHGSTSLPAAALATVAGPPFVYRSIGDPRYWSSSRLAAARVRPMFARAAAIVALWPAAAEELRDRGVRTEVVVIPNAVDTAYFRPPEPAERAAARASWGLDADAEVVLYLGALSAEKDPATAMAACAELSNVQLLVGGDGPLRRELERDAAGTVRFVGSVADPRSLLWAVDAVVIPSRTEGIPAVAIEAGACGIGVVASDVGGVSSVVLDGRTGRLVRPGDLRAVRAGVDEALRGAFDPDLARTHCVESFDLVAVAEQWDALLGPDSGRP